MVAWIFDKFEGGSQQTIVDPFLAWKRKPIILGLHSTETDNYPNYRKGSAPHFTVFPQQRTFRQHKSLEGASYSFRAPAGVSTNTMGVIQVEIVGRASNLYQLSGAPLEYLTSFLAFVCESVGIPIQCSVQFRGSAQAYGTNAPTRLSKDAFYKYEGILGHQHVPGNEHWDPGPIPIDEWIKLMKKELSAPSSPSTPVSNPKPSNPKPPTNTIEVGYKVETLDFRNADKTPVKHYLVDNLQGLLLAAGYGPDGLVGSTGRPDGIGGAKTKFYLGEWQKKSNSGAGNGKADYIAGPKTWKTLIEY